MWHPFAVQPRSLSGRSRSTPRRRAARLLIEVLEGRAVMSAIFDSVFTIGNDTTSSAMPSDTAVDVAGNTYVTGILQRPMDFDPANDRPDGSDILTPRGSSDAYVVKYAADNTFLWARSMGSDYVQPTTGMNYYERGNGVRADGAGNVYVTGTFYGQADFGPVRLTSAGSTDAFITKLDPNGNTLWAKGWGTADQDVGNDIAVDGTGNVISVGTSGFADSVQGWINNTSQVRKYSATGAAVWAHSFASPTNGAAGVATDSSGNIYMCGNFSGTVDFNPDRKKVNSVSGHYASAYILKLTSAGSFGYVSPFVTNKTVDPDSFIQLRDIAVDAGGNVVIGGYYQGLVDLDPRSTVTYRPPVTRNYNGFVAKLTTTGALAWAKPSGGDFVNAVAVDTAGAVYATGTFSTAGFTPGSGLPPVGSMGGTDAYLTKFTASGALAWATTIGGTGTESFSGLTVDASGTIYLAGYYSAGTVDLDPDPLITHERTNAAFTDMFFLKLRQS